MAPLGRASENRVRWARRAEDEILKWMNEWKKYFGLHTLRWSRKFFSDALPLGHNSLTHGEIINWSPRMPIFRSWRIWVKWATTEPNRNATKSKSVHHSRVAIYDWIREWASMWATINLLYKSHQISKLKFSSCLAVAFAQFIEARC